MKLFYFIGVLLCRADDPVISTRSVYELVFDSFQLGKDLSTFAVGAVHQQIPRSARSLVAHYLVPVYSTYALPIYEASLSGLAGASEFLKAELTPFFTKGLNLVELQQSRLDSAILEFESQYPSQAGKIGKSFFDRLILLLWLLFLARLVLRISSAVIRLFFWPLSMRRSVQVVHTPKRKQEMTPPAPRTSKKKIVISNMDILFLKTPSETCLDATDLEFVRQLTNQRIQKKNGLPLTPGATPLIQPVLPQEISTLRR